MKKIVYLLDLLNIGGAELQIIETVSRMNRNVFTPKLYCISGWEHTVRSLVAERGIDISVFNDPGAAYPVGKSRPFLWLRKFLALYRYLQREQPDIIHCCMYMPSIYGGIAAKAVGNPVLITNRVSLGYFKETKPYYQFLENMINRFTDGVIVNAQAVKDDVLKRERIKADKVHIVYNGVDTERYKPLAMTPDCYAAAVRKKSELGIPETARVIGMIANLIPYKGYHEFLTAASDVQRVYPNTYFLCIGEDRGIQRQLEQYADELTIRQHVVFTAARAGMAELLQVMDIQVLASYEEGLSNAILEGMATGKPIIATAVGGTPELVIHEVTGFLIPPKNHARLAQTIITLLDNPELAAQLGRNGRQRVETHFFMQQLIDRLEHLYLELYQQKMET